jgi:hypothetical protein
MFCPKKNGASCLEHDNHSTLDNHHSWKDMYDHLTSTILNLHAQDIQLNSESVEDRDDYGLNLDLVTILY